jgi:hypothetical protein
MDILIQWAELRFSTSPDLDIIACWLVLALRRC